MTVVNFCILIEVVLLLLYFLEIPQKVQDHAIKSNYIKKEFSRGYAKALYDILERGYYCDEFGNRHKIEVKENEKEKG